MLDDVSEVEAHQVLTTNAENQSSVTLGEEMEEEKEEEVKSKVGTAEQEELDRMYEEKIAAKQLEIEELAKKHKESTESQRLLHKYVEEPNGEIESLRLATRKELGPTHMVGTEPITDKPGQPHHKPQISTPLPVLPIEPTCTSLLEGHESMTDTPSTINQPETSLGLGQSLNEQPSNVTTKKKSSISDPPPKKVIYCFTVLVV